MTTGGSNASPGAPSRTHRLPPLATSNHPQSKQRASLVSSSSAGASPISSSSPTSTIAQNAYKLASGSSCPRSPSRLPSIIQAPAVPQQEINEKVRDAFEDLELGNISPAQSVYTAEQQPVRPDHSDALVRSRSRECSRGRMTVRNAGEMEWDEKRVAYENASGPSNTRPPLTPQEPPSGTLQAPIRSSSLTTASFTRPQSSLSPVAFIQPPPYAALPSFASSTLPSYPNNYSPYSLSVRRMLLTERIRPWLPFLAYGGTIIGFALAIGFWREEVFGGLDELAQWLRAEEEKGYAVMFFLIFLTCIPPIPLYSTLQILSGYTFGVWTGTIVSYFSALAGALFVFWMSRSIPSLQRSITSCMSHSRALQRVVRAISRRPSLLFLVRLAPYPYNVLNALLAGCPRLTFRTYASCTALSLLKVAIHTSMGAGIKSFAEYHAPSKGDNSKLANDSDEESSYSLGQMSSILGVVLCVVLSIYLTYVARRAVDEELEDDDNLECPRGRSHSRARSEYGVRADDEERAAFLDESHDEGLGSDFAAFVSASSSGPVRSSVPANVREMTERDNTVRLGASSPVPLSSLSATPYGPPEWSH